MLTQELLKSNEALQGLTDEQIAVITTLSQNDENAVVAKKTGEIYGGLDNDILTVSGMGKNGTEKTYDYAKRVIAALKGDADKLPALAAQVESLKASQGGGDEAAKQLQQAQADLQKTQGLYAALQQEYAAAKEEYGRNLLGVKLDADFAQAGKDLKIKTSIPAAAANMLMQQAYAKLRAYNPEYHDNADGTRTLVFKDKDGAVMRNPQNSLNPFTARELLMQELNGMGILDTRQKTGTGTGGNAGGNSGIIDLSGAKTQREAYDIIDKALLAQGKTVGSQAYQDAMDIAWKDGNVSALPR